jgi:hypothetical protein
MAGQCWAVAWMNATCQEHDPDGEDDVKAWNAAW